MVTTGSFKRVLVLALSASFFSASPIAAAKELRDCDEAMSSYSRHLMARSRPPSPARNAVRDAGEISAMPRSSSMDFRDFGVQYWGQEFRRAALESVPHGALIIEPSLIGADTSRLSREEMFSPSDITAIRQGGTRPVFGYLNVGELASYRDYWVEAFGSARTRIDLSSNSTLPAWYGGYDQRGELLSAFWTKEWELIMQQRINALLAIGFDGAFLDDVLHYFSWGEEDVLRPRSSALGGPTTVAESARVMMGLILRLSCYARYGAPNARPSFNLIVNGGPYIGWDAIDGATESGGVGLDLYHRYFNAIDAILVENALSRPDGKGLIEILQKEYAGRGMPVLTIEFWSRDNAVTDFETFRATMRDRAEENGFRTYIVPDGIFDRLYPPVSQIQASK